MYCIYRKYINALTSILIILLHHISELCTGKRHSHFLQKVHMLLCVPYIKIVLWPVLLVLFVMKASVVKFSIQLEFIIVPFALSQNLRMFILRGFSRPDLRIHAYECDILSEGSHLHSAHWWNPKCDFGVWSHTSLNCWAAARRRWRDGR